MSRKILKSKNLPLFSPKPEDTRASLCIYKDDLNPETISELLDLTPTASQAKGGVKVNKTESNDNKEKASVGGWFLSSHDSVRSLNVEHHIQWLVEQISNRHSVVHDLQEKGYKTEIWVYWLASCSNASPTLTPELMRRLANLRIPIIFDIYF